MLHDRRPAASRVACACAMAVATAAAPVREPPDAILAIPRAPLVESREHLADLQGRRGGIDVRLLLQPEHAVQNRRLLDAASHTLRYYTQSFGPYPYAGLTIVDVPRRSGLGGRAYAGLITIESRWLVMSGSLSPEVSVARGIARQWWRQVVDDRHSAAVCGSAWSPGIFDARSAILRRFRAVDISPRPAGSKERGAHSSRKGLPDARTVPRVAGAAAVAGCGRRERGASSDDA